MLGVLGSESTFADRLNHVIELVHPAGRGPYNDREISEMMTARGTPMSAAYVWAVRQGTKPNPGVLLVEALAAVLGVPASYLVSGERRTQVEQELDLLAAIRDADVREIAARSLEMETEDRHALLRLIRGLPRRRAGRAGHGVGKDAEPGESASHAGDPDRPRGG